MKCPKCEKPLKVNFSQPQHIHSARGCAIIFLRSP